MPALTETDQIKEHHQYTNPPEAGGSDFETAIIEIADMELSILAAGPFFKFNEVNKLLLQANSVIFGLLEIISVAMKFP